ncbi:MAG: CarD family transcriptional regulator [Firmicutes bacterium]|nr:CarD family transcriptional regulator [Bacillota bacterium]
MFYIGDKIVYPMHGVGVIEDIEKKTVLDEEKEYYIVRITCKDMDIMVPVSNSEDIGVRYISDRSTVSKVIKLLSEPSTSMHANWNKRYRENTDKLKTGDIFACAEVVRNLLRQDREKKLSTGEKRVLDNAKKVLASEIMSVNGITLGEALEIIDESV